jgi:hypothetical protein
MPLFNFFTASLFQRGKFGISSPIQSKRALLPLKKGGREGFLEKVYKTAKQLPDGNLFLDAAG